MGKKPRPVLSQNEVFRTFEHLINDTSCELGLPFRIRSLTNYCHESPIIKMQRYTTKLPTISLLKLTGRANRVQGWKDRQMMEKGLQIEA